MANSSSYSDEVNFVEISSNEGSDTDGDTRASDSYVRVEEGLKEEDFVAIEGFAISDIESSIKTLWLEGYCKKFNFDPSVGLRAPDQSDDLSWPKVGDAVFHVTFFEYGLYLPFRPVFCEILHKWRLESAVDP